jgi:hypothetical protein
VIDAKALAKACRWQRGSIDWRCQSLLDALDVVAKMGASFGRSTTSGRFASSHNFELREAHRMPNRRAFREAAQVENFCEKQALFILSCCIAPPF